MTSESLAFVVSAAGVIIAAWVADNFETPRAWLDATSPARHGAGPPITCTIRPPG